MQIIKKFKFISIFLILLISSCAKIDPVTGEKILIEQDASKRAREFADKGEEFLETSIILALVEQNLNLQAQMFFGELLLNP